MASNVPMSGHCIGARCSSCGWPLLRQVSPSRYGQNPTAAVGIQVSAYRLSRPQEPHFRVYELAGRWRDFRPIHLQRCHPRNLVVDRTTLRRGHQPAVHRVPRRPGLFCGSDRAAIVVDCGDRHRHGPGKVRPRLEARRPGRRMFPLSGAVQSVVERHDHLVLDRHRRSPSASPAAWRSASPHTAGAGPN